MEDTQISNKKGIVFPSVVTINEEVATTTVAISEPYNVFSSCVQTARLYSKYEVPRKNAIDFKRGGMPTVGGMALFSYGRGEEYYHVAVVDKMGADGFYVKEGNYIPDEYSYRFVEWNNKNLLGFCSDKC